MEEKISIDEFKRTEITIGEIQRITANDSPGYLRVYIKLTATEGSQSITEEFHIGRQVVGRRIVTNASGWLKSTDGNYYDPSKLPNTEPAWEFERVVTDFKAEILGVLRRTMRGKLDRRAKQDSVGFMKKGLTFGDKLSLPQLVRDLEGTKVE